MLAENRSHNTCCISCCDYINPMSGWAVLTLAAYFYSAIIVSYRYASPAGTRALCLPPSQANDFPGHHPQLNNQASKQEQPFSCRTAISGRDFEIYIIILPPQGFKLPSSIAFFFFLFTRAMTQILYNRPFTALCCAVPLSLVSK